MRNCHAYSGKATRRLCSQENMCEFFVHNQKRWILLTKSWLKNSLQKINTGKIECLWWGACRFHLFSIYLCNRSHASVIIPSFQFEVHSTNFISIILTHAISFPRSCEVLPTRCFTLGPLVETSWRHSL